MKVDRAGSGERILLSGSVSGLGSRRLRGVIWQRVVFSVTDSLRMGKKWYV